MRQPAYQIILLIFALGLVGCGAPSSASAGDGLPATPMHKVGSATTLLVPDLTATVAAQVILRALAAPPTALKTETPTPNLVSTSLPTATPRHDLTATQTVIANALATALAGTLMAQPTPSLTFTPTPNLAATQTRKAQGLATAVAATLTAAAPTATPLPRVYNFAACLELCTADHANARRIFPAGVKKIYLEWSYENLPVGARYTRVWTLQGQGEWVRYQCTWPGPPTGMDKVTLSEPDGLHSGVWEVVITVNDVVLLREQITVEENWDYWFYAGTFNSCYGKLH